MPERPRSEPEIIPPNAPNDPSHDSRNEPWTLGRNGRVWTSFNGMNRVYVTRVGPFGMAMAMLSVGLIAALGFLVLIGALAILLPLAGLLLAGIIIAAVLRGPRR